MEITLKSIQEKLGFDPLNPPKREINPHEVDDHTPSMWSPLTEEEKVFLLKLRFGDKFNM